MAQTAAVRGFEPGTSQVRVCSLIHSATRQLILDVSQIEITKKLFVTKAGKKNRWKQILVQQIELNVFTFHI